MQSTLLAFNFLPLKAAWQIGLHEPSPLVSLSSSSNTYAALNKIEKQSGSSPLTGYLGV